MYNLQIHNKDARLWARRHKNKVKHTMYKSHAKTFVNKFANLNELKQLENLIINKIKEMKKK